MHTRLAQAASRGKPAEGFHPRTVTRQSQSLRRILFASSGVEREITTAAARLGGLPVGQVGHLLALRVLSESERRLQDRIDIQELAKVATDED